MDFKLLPKPNSVAFELNSLQIKSYALCHLLHIILFLFCVMIKMLFWNIRGVSRALNLKRLRKLITLYSLQLVAICEPKADLERIDSIRLKLGMDCCIANQWGSLWIFLLVFF